MKRITKNYLKCWLPCVASLVIIGPELAKFRLILLNIIYSSYFRCPLSLEEELISVSERSADGHFVFAGN